MTFETEEVQTKFHELPTQTQLDYCQLEIYLARADRSLHIFNLLRDENDSLQVVIRINEKLKQAP